MNVLTVIMAVFAVIGALDRIMGNRFGIGREFERGFMMLGSFALCMIGMIVMSPMIAYVLDPVLTFVGDHLPIDPSSFTALLFPNDLGGAHLAVEVGRDVEVALFNAMITSAMFAVTVAYTVPVSMELCDRAHVKDVFLGFLCGIVTVPIGSFIGGLLGGISAWVVLLNLIPQIIFTVVISICLLKFPDMSLKVFAAFGTGIKIVITAGLALGVFLQLTGLAFPLPLGTFAEGATIVFNSGAVLCGAFPLVWFVSRVFRKPLRAFGRRMGVNDVAATGFLASLASSTTTFVMMTNMDRRGIVYNAAFAVSGAFTFGGHLAFTLVFAPDWLAPMIVSKLVAAVLSLPVAAIVFNFMLKKEERALVA